MKSHIFRYSMVLISMNLSLPNGHSEVRSRTSQSEASQFIAFPQSLTDGRTLHFRTIQKHCGEGTGFYNTWGDEADHYLYFKRDGSQLAAYSLEGDQELFSFKIVGEQAEMLEIDFNQTFNSTMAADVIRDHEGKPLPRSDGSPYQWEEKQLYEAIPSSLKAQAKNTDRGFFIDQDFKLETPYNDAVSGVAVICGAQYSFGSSTNDASFEPTLLHDEEAKDRFTVDGSGVATKININQPIEIGIDPKMPLYAQDGVRNGFKYWNEVFGRKIFIEIEVKDVSPILFERNVVLWVEEELYGAGVVASYESKTGQLLHGIEVQLPRDMFKQFETENPTPFGPWRVAYTTAHELGHLLGLEHNFYSGPPGELDITCVSVMCYPQHDKDDLMQIFIGLPTFTMPYDVKAINYLYLGKTDILPNPFVKDDRN